jgi:hypothetical protein
VSTGTLPSVASGLPSCDETTAPMAATASSPPTRATALLIADAIPASCSGTPPSTVAVSGATVSDRPKPKTTTAGSTCVR